MTDHYAGLVPAFADKVRALMEACRARGVEMRPYCGVRSPEQQAREWRKGRTGQQIASMMMALRQQGAPHLAAVIGAVGPQHGARVTNAWPGQSYHQHGLAMDCFVVAPDGAADWDAKSPGWAVYAEEAERLGLVPGRRWGDGPHVEAATPRLSGLSARRLDMMMVERFPELSKLR